MRLAGPAGFSELMHQSVFSLCLGANPLRFDRRNRTALNRCFFLQRPRSEESLPNERGDTGLGLVGPLESVLDSDYTVSIMVRFDLQTVNVARAPFPQSF